MSEKPGISQVSPNLFQESASGRFLSDIQSRFHGQGCSQPCPAIAGSPKQETRSVLGGLLIQKDI